LIKSGFFLITDISGYTQFLTDSELVHANEILQSLLKSQLENIKPPFKVSRFQGDAIQTYAISDEIIRPEMIVEMVEQIYFQFKDHVRQADFNTTCDCTACSNIKNLDLKIIVHHGEFIIQNMGDREELQGRDVIVAHRLEKNSIKDKHGISAYAVFSSAAIRAAKMDAIAENMIAHKEEYDHLGQVELFIHNLDHAWEEEKKRQKSFISKEEAWVYGSIEVPISQAIAWDIMVNPESKQKYLGMNKIEGKNLLNNRTGEGTQYHCSHDLGDFQYKIVDWSPYSYFTAVEMAFGLKYRKTYRLSESKKNYTLFELLFEKPILIDSDMTVEEMHKPYQDLIDSSIIGFSNFVQAHLKGKETTN
jgi:hypothetical protein